MVLAFIFDMDGVIIDSNPYHKIAWSNFLKNKGLPFNDEIFYRIISGKTGEGSLRILFEEDLSPEQVEEYLREIDGGFQNILREAENVKPTSGHTQEELLEAGVSLVINDFTNITIEQLKHLIT